MVDFFENLYVYSSLSLILAKPQQSTHISDNPFKLKPSLIKVSDKRVRMKNYHSLNRLVFTLRYNA